MKSLIKKVLSAFLMTLLLSAAIAESTGPAGLPLSISAEAAVSQTAKPDSRSASEMKALKKKLNSMLSAYGGSWSVYVKRLDTGDTICVNASRRQRAASLIKLYIAGAYEKNISSGAVSAAYLNKMDVMLSRSDNYAANLLISKLGYSRINRFIGKNGFAKTVCRRKMLQLSKRDNYTSARDCGKLLEKIYDGSYVNRKASKRMLRDLKNQTRRWKIPAGVPQGITVANKTGELANVENDAAIVWGKDCTYILVVMSQNVTPSKARKHIVSISQKVYSALN